MTPIATPFGEDGVWVYIRAICQSLKGHPFRRAFLKDTEQLIRSAVCPSVWPSAIDVQLTFPGSSGDVPQGSVKTHAATGV